MTEMWIRGNMVEIGNVAAYVWEASGLISQAQTALLSENLLLDD